MDVAYADNPSNLKSTSGYIFKFARGTIFWRSWKQSVDIAMSSMETEYVGYSLASKSCQGSRLYIGDTQVVTLYGDNQPAIALTGSTDHHARTKHIDIQWHYVQEQVKAGLITLAYLRTNDMPVDGLDN